MILLALVEVEHISTGTDGMHKATPCTGDFMVSLNALQSCRQQDLHCNQIVSSKALLTAYTSAGEAMAISMTWESPLYVNICEPNLHIGQSAFTVRCICQHASPTIVLRSSLAGSPRRLALLLPEYSSRRGGVQSGPLPACVPLPWEGNHALGIRVSPTPLLVYYNYMYLQGTCWPLLSAGFLGSHDHVLTGQSWRAGISGNCNVCNVETNCWALNALTRKCDKSQAVHQKGVCRPRPRGPQRAENAASKESGNKNVYKHKSTCVQTKKSDRRDEHPPTHSCSLVSHIFTWDLFTHTRKHTFFRCLCVLVCACVCKMFPSLTLFLFIYIFFSSSFHLCVSRSFTCCLDSLLHPSSTSSCYFFIYFWLTFSNLSFLWNQ